MTFDLGSGNVKAAMKEAGAGSSDLWKVPLENLHVVDGFNVRADGAEHKEHIEMLTHSILENGFYASRPLAGYVTAENRIVITDGHCRFEAVLAANRNGAEITHLPVVVSPKGTSMEDLVVGLVTNNSGKPLSQFEIGTVCKRLVGYGWDEKQIAQRLAMTTQRVTDLLSLVAAPAPVRKLVADGKVSATQAIDTLKRHGSEAGEVLKAGVQKAAASGKAKATRKDIEARPTCRAVVKELIAWAEKQSESLPYGLAAIVVRGKDSL